MAEPINAGLAIYNVPRAVGEPLLRSLRMVNTAADAVFYDVCALWRQLGALDRGVAQHQYDVAVARPGHKAGKRTAGVQAAPARTAS